MISLLAFGCVKQLKVELRLGKGHRYLVAGPESRLLRLKEPLTSSRVNPRSMWL